jgi:N-acetyl-anhydromuramyl-L-alanine amidase AmpD/peptidoglycan/xylan/chitin deacetylase (PgdA/CDA1 family)
MMKKDSSHNPLLYRFIVLVCLSIIPLSCSVTNTATPQPSPTYTVEPSQSIQPTEKPQISTETPRPTPVQPTHTPTREIDQPSSLVEGPLAKRLPILEYHETSFTMSGNRVKMTEEWFLEQMKWLVENGFETLSAEELLGYVNGTYLPPERSVVLTFDVGSAKADEYDQTIIPTLRKHGYEAILIVLINAITEDGEGNTISWMRLREWQKEGIVSVQSHGVYHPDYQRLSFNQMVWDAETSSKKIEDEMGEKPSIFAFPFDSVPERNLDLLMERAGYQLGLAGTRLERSVLPGDSDRHALPRYYPYSNDDAYPFMSDGRGWTFPEMMLSAIRDPDTVETTVDEPELEHPPMADPYIPQSLDDLLSYCARSIPDKILGLDQYARFPTDINLCTQSSLDADVIIKPTCNFGSGIIPEAIILHFTYGPYSSTVNEFRESELESSAHYIIDRDGTITQMVPEVLSANHVTCYGNREMCTDECLICEDDEGRLTEPKFRSIGIELVNVGRLRGEPGDFRNPDGSAFAGLVYEDDLISWGYRYWEDYPQPQIDALQLLLIDLMQRWNISLERVLGHGEVQINKIDPGPALNLFWDRTGDPARGAIFSNHFTLPGAICSLPEHPEGCPFYPPE